MITPGKGRFAGIGKPDIPKNRSRNT